MSDNVRGGSVDGSLPLIAADEVAFSGDTAQVQLTRLVGVTGAEGSKTTVAPTIGHDVGGVGVGRKTVATAGTRVALVASSTPAKYVVITAETDNTSYVVVGSAAGVIAALATREGIPLLPGDSIAFPCDDLADIGLDSLVNTEGVSFMYFT